MTSTKRGWLFLVLAFGIAWALVGGAKLAGLRMGTVPFTIMEALMMFAPLASALILSTGKSRQGILKDNIAFRFRMGWSGFFLSWLIFPAAAFLALGIALLLPGVSYDPSMTQMIERATRGLSPDKVEAARQSIASMPLPPILLTLLQGLAAGITINAVAGFGEEAGWRGFLVRELRGSSFWGAALFTGAVWGLWHAPVILQGHNYPDHPVFGVFMMIAWCMLLSPVFLYIRLRTKSAVAAGIAHGTLNATAGVSMMPLSGGTDLSIGLTGAAGFLALAAVLAILILADRKSGRRIFSSRLGEQS